MKIFLRLFLPALLLLIVFILYRTFTFRAKEPSFSVTPVHLKPDPQLLAGALTFETISHKPGMIDDPAFTGYHAYLDSVFPQVKQVLKKETVNKYSLIYTWAGKNTSLPPLVLMAHMDVVPVEFATLDQWDHPPFGGIVTGDFIYGRGALDDKGSMIAILYAVDELLKTGFTPERTVILCFGHDEEIGGDNGAKAMAAVLKDRGISAYMVLDEGGTLSHGLVPGIKKPVALVGTSEKGYLSLELTADIGGGHSSMPEERTALGAVNEAVYRLQQNPLPDRLTEPLEGFVAHIGPELPFIQKMAFANTWLFRPLIFREYKKSASGAALISTTQVPTIFQSGIKDNIVPNRAKAVVNYRLLPGDDPEEIVKRAIEIVNDTSVRITVLDNMAIPASPVSDHRSPQFARLSASVKAVYPEALVSPYLVLGATDSRHFYTISRYVYRFSPVPIGKEDIPRIHGLNERISLQGFENSINFYATLLKDIGNS